MTDDILPIAHRVWAEPEKPNRKVRRQTKRRPEPGYLLVVDTETTIDQSQYLTFGCYRYYRVVDRVLHCIEEGLFHADDLAETDPTGMAVLAGYVENHRASADHDRPLTLRSRTEFVERTFFPAMQGPRARFVGLNVPFDLSRLAIGATDARGFNYGGISLILSKPKDGTAHRERKHRSRVAIKHRDSKGAFLSFTKPMEPDDDLLIATGSESGVPNSKDFDRGRFLDLRTLAFALTGTAYSLEGACLAFGVPGKFESGGHGVITPKYIDYCRQDVAATVGLYEALMYEFRLHPVDLEPEKAYSPASLSKAYLSAMGITPLLDRHSKFSRDVLGYSMASFFGGRAECRIRRIPVPVALVDFTSMYPTVDALMDLHRLQLAKQIRVVDATRAVADLVESVNIDDCFDPEFWPQLVGFALVEPNDDILPVRAAYNGKTWGIGVNPLTSNEPLWYSLADVVASKLLTGKSPKILRAIRLVPVGSNARLRSVRLRGALEVDPMAQDPMVTMVEERQRVRSNERLPEMERDRLAAALKLVANAGSYGIYSEFNRQEGRKGATNPVRVHGRKGPFSDRVNSLEDPGKYCFPPFASCITGAARLMLAMLERCVTDLGGTWVFCDTDSMAIVSTAGGSLVPCLGGSYRMSDGREAVQALSYDQVESIREQFSSLNPYDQDAVPDILKLEATATCFAVSAKRYALYDLDDNGNPDFGENPKVSEHGLGHFMNPTDADSEDRTWIPAIWRAIIQKTHGKDPDLPGFLSRPTMVRTTVTSPAVLRAFRHHNGGRSYAEQIKPFNFLITAAGAKPPAGIPLGRPFRLVAPFEKDPSKWEGAKWIDLHHPEVGSYPITTQDGRPGMARVDTFSDVLAKYETHPESKSLGPNGEPCGRATVGLLRRQPVRVGKIVLIGKESNRLEERSRGEVTVDDLDDRITTYEDHDEWYRVVLPRLREVGVTAIAAATGVSERRVRSWLREGTMPHQRHRAALLNAVV
jgi:hypothetical protein